MKTILTLFIYCISVSLYAQDCAGINTSINQDMGYDRGSYFIPLNSSWGVSMENQNSIEVFLQTTDTKANCGVIKNLNGSFVKNGHSLTDEIVNSFINGSVKSPSNIQITNSYLKNIPVKLVTFNSKQFNLDRTLELSSVVFMLVKENYTYVFMFSSLREEKECYIPFFKNVMKNAYFDDTWY